MRTALQRVFCALVLCVVTLTLSAQSHLHYELRIGATDKVALLDTFPAIHTAEKLNISLAQGTYTIHDYSQSIPDSLDYIFASTPLPNATQWGDSVYSYTDTENTRWTLWCNHKEIKNRTRRVLVLNGREAMQEYVVAHTQQETRIVAWMGWVLAALLLIGGIARAVIVYKRRQEEKNLPSVEQERLRRHRSDNRRHYGTQFYLWLILIVLYAPIALIAVFSFTESKILGNWTGFSFDLYLNLFSGRADAGLNNAILYTLGIALIAAVGSTILGTLAAIGIYNMRAKQRKIVTMLNSVPMINPDIITGISLFLLFVALGISQGLTTVCIAHIVFCTPYVVLNVLPRLSRMNPNIYEAALDLGATPFQALRMVMLPELWPGMLSGFILALTLSVDDFGVTFFTKGSGGLETLSTFIYSDARKGGLTPELRPLFTIILLVMLTVLVFINMRERKLNKNNN